MKDLIQIFTVGMIIVFMVSGMVVGCTYTVTENNRRYYESMNQCMERGGHFVPMRGDSTAACIMR